MRNLILIALICFATTYCHAGTRDSILTKHVYRVVNIIDTSFSSTDYYKLKLTPQDIETPFCQALVDLAIGHQINVYASVDSSFSFPLNDLKRADFFVLPKADTEVQEDTVTGQRIIRIVQCDFKIDDITKYKVMEDWSYNRNTGKTNIHVVALAPLQDVYEFKNGDYKYTGTHTSLWFKYDDIKGVLKKYANQYPAKNIPLAIWEDYFSEKNK